MFQLTKSRFPRQPRIVPLPSTTLGNRFDELHRESMLQSDERASVRRWLLADHGVVYQLRDGSYAEWVNGYRTAWRALYSESGKTIRVDSFPAWARRLEEC